MNIQKHVRISCAKISGTLTDEKIQRETGHFLSRLGISQGKKKKKKKSSVFDMRLIKHR